MAHLPNIKMLPTIMSSVNICAWFLLIVFLSSFSSEHNSGVQAWTTDVIPTLKIKYGKFFFCHYEMKYYRI